jgi:hypothetical protein
MARAADKKPRSEKRRATKHVQKRVTPAAYAAFEKRASDAGYDSPNDYLNAFVLGEELIQQRARQERIKLLAELGKQGSNLNQIARALNKGQVSRLTRDDLRTLEDTAAIHKALMAAVQASLS